MILIFCSCHVHTTAVILKASMGMAFIEEPRTLFPLAGSKDLTFVIKLPDFTPIEILKVQDSTCDRMTVTLYKDMCKVGENNMVKIIDKSNGLIAEINSEILNIKQILQTLRLSESSKRALIDISGFLETFFGTARAEKVSKLHNDIKNMQLSLEQASDDRKSIFDTMKLMAESNVENFDSVFHMINDTNRYVDIALNTLSVNNEKVNELYQLLMNPNAYSSLHVLHLQTLMLVHGNDCLREKLGAYKSFTRDLFDLMAGKIPFSIIPTEHLKRGLKSLSESVRIKSGKRWVPFNHDSHLHLYYDKFDFAHAGVIHDSLIITVNVPFLTSSTSFDAYKLLTFPTPVHSSKGRDQSAYSILSDVPEYLIVEKTRESYRFLTEAQFHDCAIDNNGLCKDLTVTFPSIIEKCAWSIFRDYAEGIRESCKFVTVVNKELATNIIPITNNQYLVANPQESLSLTCPDGDHYLKLSNLSLIETPCGCDWKIKTHRVSPRLDACTDRHDSPVVQHPVSYAALEAFNLTHHMKLPFTHVLSKDPPKVPLPDLTALIGSPDKSDYKPIANNKLAEKLKTIRMHGYKRQRSNYHNNYSTYIWSSLAAWNFILSVAVVFLTVRTRSFLPLMMSQAAPTNAFVIPTDTPAQDEVIDVATGDLHTDIYVYVLIIAGLILVFHKILQINDFCGWRINKIHRILPYCISPESESLNVGLYLVMEALGDNVAIFIQTIPVALTKQNFVMQVPKCTSIGVFVEYCKPKLIIEWEGVMKFSIQGKTKEYAMPENVPITWGLYTRIAHTIQSVSDISEIKLVTQSAIGSSYEPLTQAIYQNISDSTSNDESHCESAPLLS